MPGPGTLTHPARCFRTRAPAPGARLARAKNIGRGKVVPATTLTDLNDVRPELAIFGGHLGQFIRLLDPPFIPAQLVPVHVRHVGELGPAADRAAGVGRLAVELCGTEQVGMRVADIRDGGVTGKHRRERCPAGKRVVDHASPGCHLRQTTTHSLPRRDPPGRDLSGQRYAGCAGTAAGTATGVATSRAGTYLVDVSVRYID